MQSYLDQVCPQGLDQLWPEDFGEALEIGCGTGGFSLALLQHISARHIVLTDVSEILTLT